MSEERKINVKVGTSQWCLNGRVVTPEKMEKYLMALPGRAFEATIRQRVERLRCPHHSRRPRMIVGHGADGRSAFTVQTCCPEFERLIGLVLRYEPPPQAIDGDRN